MERRGAGGSAPGGWTAGGTLVGGPYGGGREVELQQA